MNNDEVVDGGNRDGKGGKNSSTNETSSCVPIESGWHEKPGRSDTGGGLA